MGDFRGPHTGSPQKYSVTTSYVPTQESLGDKPHLKYVTNLPQSCKATECIRWSVPWEGKPGVRSYLLREHSTLSIFLLSSHLLEKWLGDSELQPVTLLHLDYPCGRENHHSTLPSDSIGLAAIFRKGYIVNTSGFAAAVLSRLLNPVVMAGKQP